MFTSYLTKKLKPSSGKKMAFSTMMLVQLVVSMQKNANRSILISLFKAQVQVKNLPIKPDKLNLLKLLILQIYSYKVMWEQNSLFSVCLPHQLTGLWLSVAEQWVRTQSDGEYQLTYFSNEYFTNLSLTTT